MPENIWPDFSATQGPPTPRAVIQDAGAGLEEKTKGLVKFYSGTVRISDDFVEADFSLYSPRISYMFPFLRTKHKVQSFYPATLITNETPEIVVENEQALRDQLVKIFNAPAMIQAIQRLMALSRE